MALAIGGGQALDHRQCGRDRGNTQAAGEPVAERMHFLPHGACVADNAPRPIEHPLTFRRKILKSGRAINQKDAERIFQLFDTGRQSGLRDAADVGGAGKMLFARQSKEEFKLIDQVRRPWIRSLASARS